MYQYKLYGLEIHSVLKISLLNEQLTNKPDLIINWTTDPSDSPETKLKWKRVMTEGLKMKKAVTFWEAEDEKGVYSKVCFGENINRYLHFILDPTKKILWIIHGKNESKEDLESILIGPIMGCVLRLRGVVCLHSSVVNIDQKAVAIIGEKRSGKSTTAAGLAKSGAKVLADDIAVITNCNDEILVQPGYSKIRLRPTAAEFLTENPEALPIVYSDRNSRYLSLTEDDQFFSESLPLAAIYVLGTTSDNYDVPSIESLEPKEGLVKLIENTFGNYVVSRKLKRDEFKFLAQIANAIPIRRLMHSHNIETLPLQARTITGDFRQLNAFKGK